MHAARLAHRSLRAANILVAAGRPGGHRLRVRRPSPRGERACRPSTAPSCSCRWRRSSAPMRRSRRPPARSAPPHSPTRGAVPPTAGAVRRDPQAGVQGAPARAPRRDRHCHRRGARPARAAGARPGPHAVHDRGAHRARSTCCSRSSPTSATASTRSGSANWSWLVVCVVMSMVTYVAAAIGLAGGVPEPLPFVPNLAAQMASSFVNRVTPGQRRRHGAQRALPAEGRRSARRGGHRHRPQRRWPGGIVHLGLLAAVRRVGGPERHQRVQDPVEQQVAGDHRGGARASSGWSRPRGGAGA